MCVSLWWYINAQSETCQRAVSFAFNVLPLTQSKNFVSVSQCLSVSVPNVLAVRDVKLRQRFALEAPKKITRASDPSNELHKCKASAELVVGVEPWVVSHLHRKCLSHGLQDSNQQPILFNTSLLKKNASFKNISSTSKCIGDYHCHGEYCNLINI